MVLLTMTASTVEALGKAPYQSPLPGVNAAETKSSQIVPNNTKSVTNSPEDPILAQIMLGNRSDSSRMLCKDSTRKVVEDIVEDIAEKPSLKNPAVGNPISHGQILDLSARLKSLGMSSYSLEVLLRGVRVYIPPPPPKPEPTSEYKALMARLRREQEHREYERMTNPLPPMETFAQAFPSSSAAHAFSSNQDTHTLEQDEELTYADIDRQMALIFNVLISIVACAGGLWVVARWWSTPARLALSMGGSLLVGIAEVVVYAGYIRRVGEAKAKAKDLKEVKEVFKTWVVGGGEDRKGEDELSMKVIGADNKDNDKARRRKKPA